jgi:phosphoglycolate phosphatase-like HAD superfamily hydrolase
LHLQPRKTNWRDTKEVAEIDDLISAETSSDDADKSKPHPDIFQAAMKRLGNKRPETIIMVGDTSYDAEAAIKVGLQTIGLLCGGWSEDELKQASCIAVYRNLADLLRRYSDSPLVGEILVHRPPYEIA